MSEWTIYFWTRLDGVLGVSIGIAIVSGILSLISTLMYPCCKASPEYNKQELAFCKAFVPKVQIIFVLSLLVALLLPTQKEFALIKVLPKLANSQLSQDIQKDIPEMYAMAKNALKDMIKPKETR